MLSIRKTEIDKQGLFLKKLVAAFYLKWLAWDSCYLPTHSYIHSAIYIHYKMITSTDLINVHHHTWLKKKDDF